ncbi:LLM class flavin-dependent oxidoreductase [Terribacillus saccharophilus]|uniref:LLM class flavin-dependent oxidoreductase n=1 Tax=Terribacillus saccharophilus TaxID=361277 RepID=UPI00398262BB
MTKQIILQAFDMTAANHNAHGLWKHPENRRHREYRSLDYWIELAQLLEKGKFDAVFFADVLGVYDVYGGDEKAALRDGVQVPLNDPAFAIPAMAAVTKHLSFAVTVSTSYEQPFHNARKFSTLDHLTNGRVAWNIVTSYLPNAAQNFGLEKMVKHDERYQIADEFLEVSYKLLEDSWEEDALVANTETGVLVDPEKVHRIKHKGSYFSVEGPHVSEPSPQRTPVLYQAGTSEKGRDFAAKHAECVFVGGPTPEKINYYIEDIKARTEAYGRSRDEIKAFTFLHVVVAETEEKARAKYDEIKHYWSADAAKAQYGGSTGYDLASYENEEELFTYKHTEQGQSRAAYLTKDAAKPFTVKEIQEKFSQPAEMDIIIGSPEQVADKIEDYFVRSGVDGFNLTHYITPKDLQDFVELVVPILQERGLYKKDYAEGTFREKLYGHPHLAAAHPAKQGKRS